MAEKRVCNLTIGDNTGLGLLISDLNISFQIERSYKLTDNTAKITIYNAQKSTRDKILQKDNNVILECGYEDEGSGRIFSGFIFESASKKNGTEWQTDLICYDYGANDRNILNETPNFGYKEGIPVTMVLNDIASMLNITISGIENASQIFMNNAKIFTGNLKNIIKNIENILKVNNVGLYFDSNEMVIYKLGKQESKFGVISISQENGLIGSVEKITESNEDGKKRYSFTCLMNSKIKPNVLINLKSKNVNGLFIVEKVTFTGDNFGGEFNVKAEIVE
jgi:hypothetical protein